MVGSTGVGAGSFCRIRAMTSLTVSGAGSFIWVAPHGLDKETDAVWFALVGAWRVVAPLEASRLDQRFQFVEITIEKQAQPSPQPATLRERLDLLPAIG